MSKLGEGMATELGHWESSAVVREPELCDFPKVTCWDVLLNSNVGMAGQKVLLDEVSLIGSNHRKGHSVS